jgi:hypothetical protein
MELLPACLPADRLGLQHDGPQPFGGPVHRRGQAGGARADHGDVIGDGLGAGSNVQRLGERGVGRIDQHPAIEQHHHRQPLTGRADRAEQPPALLEIHRVESASSSATCPPSARICSSRGSPASASASRITR